MGQCQTKQDIRSVLPENNPESLPSEKYIKDSTNLTKRRIKRTRSKIIYKVVTGSKP
jgi:hypothetical protein